jgi:hypothetical protein
VGTRETLGKHEPAARGFVEEPRRGDGHRRAVGIRDADHHAAHERAERTRKPVRAFARETCLIANRA